MAVTPYCTQADVEYVLSQFGVAARADDVDQPVIFDVDEVPLALQYLNNAISKATADVNLYLFQNYTLDKCVNNIWVEWCTAIFAAVELCRRRGNGPPESLLAEYERYLETLKLIATLDLILPSDTGLEAPQFDEAAGVTNYYVDSRFPAKIRRVPATSTHSPQAPTRKGFDATLPVFWPY